MDQRTNAPSEYVKFPGVTTDVIYLTYSSSWFLSSPYTNSIVFTIKAFYADYSSNSITTTFTVNELDCSIRFKGISQTETFLYFMNPILPSTLPASKSYKFNSNPSAPTVCLSSNRTAFRNLIGPLPATTPLVDTYFANTNFMSAITGGDDFTISVTSTSTVLTDKANNVSRAWKDLQG